MPLVQSAVARFAVCGLLVSLVAQEESFGQANRQRAANSRRSAAPGLLESAPNARPIPPSPSVFDRLVEASRTPGRETQSAPTQTTEAATTAILIRNPNTQNGEPPFALTDEFGRIQRLVEPSLGIDLGVHVGRTVGVRHDSGRTLLASQLDLTPRQLTTLGRLQPLSPAAPSTSAPNPIFGNLAFTPPQTVPAYDPQQPVIITQFGEGQAEAKPPTPEPIVLEEIIGEPIVQPVEGLPLPQQGAFSTLGPAAPVVVGPPATSGSATKPFPASNLAVPHSEGAPCLDPSCACKHGSSSNVFFEAELLLLRALNSDATATNENLETGSRFTLGLKSNNGNHWIARYLEYQNDLYDGSDNLSLELYDLEYGRAFHLNNRWQGLFTIGGRLTEFSEQLEYDDAIGPVVGVQLRGPCWRNLHPLLGARTSILFGEASNINGAQGFGTFSVSEFAAGLEYQRRTRRGATVFGRAAGEAILLDGVIDDDSDNAALIGFGLSLGIAR